MPDWVIWIYSAISLLVFLVVAFAGRAEKGGIDFEVAVLSAIFWPFLLPLTLTSFTPWIHKLSATKRSTELLNEVEAEPVNDNGTLYGIN